MYDICYRISKLLRSGLVCLTVFDKNDKVVYHEDF